MTDETRLIVDKESKESFDDYFEARIGGARIATERAKKVCLGATAVVGTIALTGCENTNFFTQQINNLGWLFVGGTASFWNEMFKEPLKLQQQQSEFDALFKAGKDDSTLTTTKEALAQYTQKMETAINRGQKMRKVYAGLFGLCMVTALCSFSKSNESNVAQVVYNVSMICGGVCAALRSSVKTNASIAEYELKALNGMVKPVPVTTQKMPVQQKREGMTR